MILVAHPSWRGEVGQARRDSGEVGHGRSGTWGNWSARRGPDEVGQAKRACRNGPGEVGPGRSGTHDEVGPWRSGPVSMGSPRVPRSPGKSSCQRANGLIQTFKEGERLRRRKAYVAFGIEVFARPSRPARPDPIEF